VRLRVLPPLDTELEVRPAETGVVISVQRTDLDRHTARIRSQNELFSYDRSMLPD